MNPESLDEWFPVEQQRNYISTLKGRVGITRLRSEYFVRLWAYLLLKQQHEQGTCLKRPLTQLELPEGFVSCTHREAAELFYGNKNRGSERAAGMMLDKLVALGLIEKQFDGNTICIRVHPQLSVTEPPKSTPSVPLKLDDFNPRTDAVPVASFLARNYNWMNKDVQYKIAKVLRFWGKQYPTGMRVLRRCDNLHPVGFYIFYPIARESEEYFFLPPSKSFYLSTPTEIDPLQIASPGDPDCTAVFVRSWIIDSPYMQPPHVCQFLEDAKTTLLRMKADFPNLCDMYAMLIHPKYEVLTQALGFQKTYKDPQMSIYWLYTAVDQFLALDVEQAVSALKLESALPEQVRG